MSALRSRAARVLGLALVLGLTACASTELAETWIDPGTKTLPRFQKVFVAFLGGDAAAQHLAEDYMAVHMQVPAVVKSYELFPGGQAVDAARVKDELRAKGCDGAVVMRLARVEQELSATATPYPAHYRSFSGYWGYPGDVEVRTDEIVHVETNLYSLADDKLLYSARSETFNPGSTPELVEEIAAAISSDLEKRGLRKKP